MKRLKGFCEVQQQEYEISVDLIKVTTKEDNHDGYIDGRIN